MNNEECAQLRPFDLEAAKRGEKICTSYGNNAVFIGVKSDGRVVFEDQDQLYNYDEWNLRMLPLHWLKGKPVYKGDTIYYTEDGSKHIVDSFTGTYILCKHGFDEFAIHPDYASWEKPKVKKNYWVNLYDYEARIKHASRELADKGATNEYGDISPFRIACVMITIEE